MALTAGIALFTTIHTANAITDGDRRSERLHGVAPCSDTPHGLVRYLCLSEFRYATKDENARADARDRRLVTGTEGRRLAALRERARRERNYFEPVSEFSRGHMDPRPASERFDPLPTRRSRIDEHLINQAKGRVAFRPLLKARAKAAARNEAKVPLCSKRDGIRLIGCLLDLGIEINERTADEETLEIWRNIRKEHGWLFQE